MCLLQLFQDIPRKLYISVEYPRLIDQFFILQFAASSATSVWGFGVGTKRKQYFCSQNFLLIGFLKACGPLFSLLVLVIPSTSISKIATSDNVGKGKPVQTIVHKSCSTRFHWIWDKNILSFIELIEKNVPINTEILPSGDSPFVREQASSEQKGLSHLIWLLHPQMTMQLYSRVTTF